jgi:hypothetical protein
MVYCDDHTVAMYDDHVVASGAGIQQQSALTQIACKLHAS